MLFHTWTFAVFFLVVYSGYLALRPTRYWLHWLLAASYVFYGWWNPVYLLLILYSTALDYTAVILIERSRAHKTFWLILSLSNNLLVLGIFKYAGFITAQANELLGLAGSADRLRPPGFLLPVGISFFTFQSMSYAIDYYRGYIEREPSFVRFATFVSLFPQLVAGPIERSRNLLLQLHRLPPINRHDITDGLSLFVVGLFKKLAIANYLALYVDPIYAAPDRYNAGALAMATFAFAWEIYCDFSGYTDMARGVARVMGFRLMLNFDHPYLATGLGDFWSRWHISLSSWFRDYVYIPLGGSRGGSLNTARNLFLTMVISGLWHGANWTFIAWGALHGLAYVATRPFERSAAYRRVPLFVRQIAVFAFVCFTWIFFRAANMADARLIIGRIFSTSWGDPRFPVLALALVAGLWAYEAICEWPIKRRLMVPAFRVGVVVLMVLYLCVAPGSGDVPFIYFQF
jgi:D-alanyl-lipoteichoic acid acyltransferase DltB (MBOAT superfamily)